MLVADMRKHAKSMSIMLMKGKEKKASRIKVEEKMFKGSEIRFSAKVIQTILEDRYLE